MRDERYVLMLSINAADENGRNREASKLFYEMNNSLNRDFGMPNYLDFCTYCDSNYPILGELLRKNISGLQLYSSSYETGNNINYIFSNTEDFEKKRYRVLLSTGCVEELNDYKINEATHNMIIQFNKNVDDYVATVSHRNYPVFIQYCNSIENALKYIEALLVDAVMCHYFRVYDAALHHDEKQEISNEKVLFLLELSHNKENMSRLGRWSESISRVSKMINHDTPYISLLSLFTFCDLENKRYRNLGGIEKYEAYYTIWGMFRYWYYRKHNRVFSENDLGMGELKIAERLFNRDLYGGQVSEENLGKEIKEAIMDWKRRRKDSDSQQEHNLYAIVVVKNIPSDDLLTRLNTIFPNKMHQSKMGVFEWSKLEIFKGMEDYLHIIPFIIE